MCYPTGMETFTISRVTTRSEAIYCAMRMSRLTRVIRCVKAGRGVYLVTLG
jgi:hypothetical protein